MMMMMIKMMMTAICIESPFLRVLRLQRRRRIPSELHRQLRRRLLEIADRLRRARASHLCGRLAQPEATKRAVVSVSLPTHTLSSFYFFYVGNVRARQAAAAPLWSTRASCMDVFLDAVLIIVNLGHPRKAQERLRTDDESSDNQFLVLSHIKTAEGF
jgi:hypothetical protein